MTQKPTIGRIVHYYLTPWYYQPAIITWVNDDDTVDLVMFSAEDEYSAAGKRTHVRQGELNAQGEADVTTEGAWVWPTEKPANPFAARNELGEVYEPAATVDLHDPTPYSEQRKGKRSSDRVALPRPTLALDPRRVAALEAASRICADYVARIRGVAIEGGSDLQSETKPAEVIELAEWLLADGEVAA